MFDWIGRLFSRGYSGLVDLANDIRKAISDAVNSLLSIFVGWVQAGYHLLTGAANFVVALSSMISALIRFALRVAVVYIPNAVASALNQAVAWTEHRIADVVAFVQQQVAQVVALARQLYDDLRAWTIGQVTNIIRYIHDIVTLLNDVANRVYALLTNPRALADWVAAELIGAVWRWVKGNADALVRLALTSAVSAAVSAASLIEQVIADVFL